MIGLAGAVVSAEEAEKLLHNIKEGLASTPHDLRKLAKEIVQVEDKLIAIGYYVEDKIRDRYGSVA